jgi:hypothetical protein
MSSAGMYTILTEDEEKYRRDERRQKMQRMAFYEEGNYK